MLTLTDPPRPVEAVPPRHAPGPDRPHAVVIGSGFGGLAAAIRLGARGWRVTALERLDQAGGRASVFRQDGFTFDAGPTIVTAPFLFEELWQIAGRRLSDDVTLVPCDPFYRIRFDDGETFAAFADDAAMEAEVARLSPGDLDGYRRFMAESREIFRVGFEELGRAPFLKLTDMVRILPYLLARRADRSVHALVARHVRDPRLRQALSFHPLFVGGDPFRVTAVYALIAHLEREWGVHFAMGGTGALVRGMVDLIESLGGTVRLNADVAGITVEDGRATGVHLTSGERIPADITVSNADTWTTYAKLLPASRRWSARRLDRAKWSMGLFVWYFGTDRQWPGVDHHTIVMGPRYRGLIDDIFGRKRLAADMSLYLHRPTATDPSLAPPGHDAFYVLSPVPHLGGGTDWNREAEPYRARIQARLEETVLPGLSRHVVTSRIMTPLDFRDRYRSHLGAGFGLEPRLTQSAWFRPHNRSEDIRDLYLVGAGTHPGAGLPGVLSSAAILDQLVPDAAAFR